MLLSSNVAEHSKGERVVQKRESSSSISLRKMERISSTFYRPTSVWLSQLLGSRMVWNLGRVLYKKFFSISFRYVQCQYKCILQPLGQINFTWTFNLTPTPGSAVLELPLSPRTQRNYLLPMDFDFKTHLR